MRNKVIPILAFLYVICPIDLIPDVIPILGWIDDVIAILIGIREALKKPPPRSKQWPALD